MLKKESKNEQIVIAAMEEFLIKGLEAASMHRIAELAEVSKRTLYKYYPTKDELYDSLVDKILDRFENLYDFQGGENKSTKELIEEIVSKKMEFTLNDNFIKINRIVIGELLKGRAPKPEQMLRLNQMEANFVTWIEEGQKNGIITEGFSAETIANNFHSILKGQIFWPVLIGLVDKEDLDLEQIQKSTVEFFLTNYSSEANHL